MDIKQIDLSDIRILVFGVVLLLVPVAFFAVKVKSGGGGDFSRDALNRDLQTRRARYTAGGGGVSGMALAPAPRSGGLGVSGDKAIGNELDQAWQKILNTPATVRFDPGLSIEDRQMISAENNPSVNAGNGYLELGNFEEAEKHFKAAIDSDAENPFLLVQAWGGLAQIYQRMGRQADYENAFRAYIGAIKRLPPDFIGPMGATIDHTVKMLSFSLHEVDRARLSMEVQKAAAATGQNIAPDETRTAIGNVLKLFPPPEKPFKPGQ